MENKKKHTLGFQRIIRRLLDGGGGRKFAIRPRDESGQLLSRCSSKFRKRKEGRKEGKKSLSLSPVKLNFTLLFLLSLLPPLLRKELFVGPFSEETMFVFVDTLIRGFDIETND